MKRRERPAKRVSADMLFGEFLGWLDVSEINIRPSVDPVQCCFG